MSSSSNLARWGGLAAVAAGALSLVQVFLSFDYALVVARDLASLLFLGGLVGLHARQAGDRGYGRLGATGFWLASFGVLLGACVFTLMALWVLRPQDPSGAAPGILAGILGASGDVGWWGAVAANAGLLLLGIATLRAGVLALPWRAVPLVVLVVQVLGTLLSTLFLSRPLPLSATMLGGPLALSPIQVLLGISWALLGLALWSGGSAERRTSAPAR